VLLLAFSLVFFFDHGFRHDKPLKRAFGAGATGWFIMAAVQSLAIINYVTAGRLVWVAIFLPPVKLFSSPSHRSHLWV